MLPHCATGGGNLTAGVAIFSKWSSHELFHTRVPFTSILSCTHSREFTRPKEAISSNKLQH